MEGRGQPLPKDYLERPEIDLLNVFYWESFQELSTCRMVEMGSIPWIAINEYCKRWGIEGDFFEMFNKMIRSMDRVYMKHVSDEQKAKRNKK